MSDVASKWGTPVAERGFAQIPNYLLLLNRFLDHEVRLSPLELLILIQLAGAWWTKAKLPFPSMSTLAVRCGSSERQVHRAINHLEGLKLIKKDKRRVKGLIASNIYDLAPLAEILNEISIQYPNERPRNVVSSERLEALGEENPKPEIDQSLLTAPARQRVRPSTSKALVPQSELGTKQPAIPTPARKRLRIGPPKPG